MAKPRFLVGFERRPCTIDGRRAIFHQWINRASVVPPSMIVNRHKGGQIWQVLGLVEFEDGHMEEVIPEAVRFADGGDFGDTAFREENDGRESKCETSSGESPGT